MREEKKSESLEVRLSYSQKIAFMEACKKEGLTASEALRAGIEGFLEEHSQQSQSTFQIKDVVTLMKRNIKKTLGTAGAVAAGGMLMLATPVVASDEMFERLDRNSDGVITSGEISANDSAVFEILDTNNDGEISLAEFDSEAIVTGINDNIFVNDDGEDVRVITVNRAELQALEDGEFQVNEHRWTEHVDVDATEAEIEEIIARTMERLTELEGMEMDAHIARIRAMELAENQEEIRIRVEQARDEAREHAQQHAREAIRQAEHAIVIVRELDVDEIGRMADLEGVEVDLSGLEELQALIDEHGVAAFIDLEELERDLDMEFDGNIHVEILRETAHAEELEGEAATDDDAPVREF